MVIGKVLMGNEQPDGRLAFESPEIGYLRELVVPAGLLVWAMDGSEKTPAEMLRVAAMRIGGPLLDALNALPEGSIVEQVTYLVPRQAFAFTIQHGSFDVVRAGEFLPEIDWGCP